MIKGVCQKPVAGNYEYSTHAFAKKAMSIEKEFCDAELLVLMPSLRISGGNKEVLHLASAVAERGVRVKVLVLWRHPHECSSMGLPVDYLSEFVPRKSKAFWDFWVLLGRFFRYVCKWRRDRRNLWLMLTHFSTFPFAWLAPGARWVCFNQDVEWMFVPAGPGRAALRWLILLVSRRSQVVTSNSFVSEQYAVHGIVRFAQASTWAEPFWLSSEFRHNRSVDIVMLLRQGAVKRLDLYLKFIRIVGESTTLRCAVITPENEVYEQVKGLVGRALLRPSNEEIKQLYKNSRLFVLLSDTEGFGLPPLEAMGSGCVPLCRDSGGVKLYMQGPLAAHLIPLEESVASILTRAQHILQAPDALDALSDWCREAFLQGLQKSTRERKECFDQLAERIIA